MCTPGQQCRWGSSSPAPGVNRTELLELCLSCTFELAEVYSAQMTYSEGLAIFTEYSAGFCFSEADFLSGRAESDCKDEFLLSLALPASSRNTACLLKLRWECLAFRRGLDRSFLIGVWAFGWLGRVQLAGFSQNHSSQLCSVPAEGKSGRSSSAMLSGRPRACLPLPGYEVLPMGTSCAVS